ncbi:IclR family transcriptional regulator [Oricola indica]|uniref:IclR family transcriptional regulator n=1 Tax=Oricola indica TaxID=2872591 RepID=UPI003CCBC837
MQIETDRLNAQDGATWADYVDVDLPKGAQSVVRTAALLRILATNNDEGLRLKDVAEIAGLEQPTAHRVISALNAVGFVVRHPKTRRYHLGPLLQELYIAAYMGFSIQEAVLPTLKHIAGELGDTVYLAMRNGLDSVCVERIEGSYPIRTCTVNIGMHRPLGIGAGSIALMSGFGKMERELILTQNESRFVSYKTSINEVRARCEKAEETGYDFGKVLGDVNIKALGFCLRGYSGRPIGGISVTAIGDRFDDAHLAEAIDLLRGEIAKLEAPDGPLGNVP